MSDDFEAKKYQSFLDFIDGKTDKFDMYARDPQDFTFLAEIIPGIVVTSAGGICPFQAYGTILGCPFYYRERHGWAELRVGMPESPDPMLHILSPHWSAGESVDEFRDGVHWLDSLINLVPRLTRGTTIFEFEAQIESHYGKKIASRGFDEQDAIARLRTFELSEYLIEHSCSEDDQRKEHALRMQVLGQHPVLVTGDPRVFPDVEPDFRITPPEQALLVWDKQMQAARVLTPWAPPKINENETIELEKENAS